MTIFILFSIIFRFYIISLIIVFIFCVCVYIFDLSLIDIINFIEYIEDIEDIECDIELTEIDYNNNKVDK